MHMSDSMLSVVVGGTMTAVSTGAIGYSIKKIKKIDIEDNKIPMMGVMGAFVFAAQMINFTIPGTGSSGHIGGGLLLAALLGPFPAFITLASVLLIQCLFFADGGLLALGCNIFNMGAVTCLIAYPLIYKPILKRGITTRRITIAAILTVVAGLQIGSFSVVLETYASGITKLPFRDFLLYMQPIHLAIGVVEGVISAAVLCFVYGMRKEIIENALAGDSLVKISMKRVLTCFVIATVFVGGILSLFASSNPDGLEWSMEGVAGTAELEADTQVHSTIQSVQEKTAFLPDYSYKKEVPAEGSDVSTSVSGLVGGLITLVIVLLIGTAILSFKKIKNSRMTMDKL